MILKNLYEKVLIEPLSKDANKLYIISGYASATFLNKHLTDTDNLDINLVIGMPGKRSDHLGFVNIMDRFKDRFNGFYLDSSPPVHCKLYSWFKNDEPINGFSGSANYTQPGFSSQQVNQLISESPTKIKSFFDELVIRSTNIVDFEFDNKALHSHVSTIKGSVIPGGLIWEIPDRRVRISFLANNGSLPQRSGLNWGQRPDMNREPNQAYLSVRRDARNVGFLPSRSETFTLVTDDNMSFDCVVAQGGRKAIHSTFDNSELGKYFRIRLGLPLDSPINVENLENYGRTDYTLEKLNDETFLLDFSTKK